MSLAHRIKQLENQAWNDVRCGLSIEAHRAILDVVRRDGTAVDLLRICAGLEYSARFWPLLGTSFEVQQILERLDVATLSCTEQGRAEAVGLIKTEAHTRLRQAVAKELGREVAESFFAQK